MQIFLENATAARAASRNWEKSSNVQQLLTFQMTKSAAKCNKSWEMQLQQVQPHSITVTPYFHIETNPEISNISKSWKMRMILGNAAAASPELWNCHKIFSIIKSPNSEKQELLGNGNNPQKCNRGEP